MHAQKDFFFLCPTFSSLVFLLQHQTVGLSSSTKSEVPMTKKGEANPNGVVAVHLSGFTGGGPRMPSGLQVGKTWAHVWPHSPLMHAQKDFFFLCPTFSSLVFLLQHQTVGLSSSTKSEVPMTKKGEANPNGVVAVHLHL